MPPELSDVPSRVTHTCFLHLIDLLVHHRKTPGREHKCQHPPGGNEVAKDWRQHSDVEHEVDDRDDQRKREGSPVTQDHERTQPGNTNEGTDEQSEHHFALALKQARELTGRNQEEFDGCSSRTYISALERGLKIPTLSKVDQMAAVMGVHPLVILAMAYAKEPTPNAVQDALHHATQQAWSLMAGSMGAGDKR
ncbi:MAG: hypothetical protein CVU36_23545 [Betaproteobacteria bacterium HGW-Betaproteobacteria-9]|jgi:transcriptional regulator with XRE-family HTH domain|nr:MAG: hypothetical protein CVU36_23545 [Betaproteobacteria bacterium HGW-Betaproteobacteria-9]